MAEFVATGDPHVDIPALIGNRGNGLTFVELLKYLPYLKGDFAYGNRETNIIFWSGLSERCIEALNALEKSAAIRRSSTAPLTYFIDGAVPNLPVAKSNRRYKKPHWVPITFSLVKKMAA